jgi:hemimethylated DNA binding protein
MAKSKIYTVVCDYNGVCVEVKGTLSQIKDWMGIDHGYKNNVKKKSWYTVLVDNKPERRILTYRNTIQGLVNAVNYRNELIAYSVNAKVFPKFSVKNDK